MPAAAITVTETLSAACLAQLTWAEQASWAARMNWWDQSHPTVPCQRQSSPLPRPPALQLWLHRRHLAGRSAVLRGALCLGDSAALEGRPAAQWLGQGRQQGSGTAGFSSDHLPSQVSDVWSDLRWPGLMTVQIGRQWCIPASPIQVEWAWWLARLHGSAVGESCPCHACRRKKDHGRAEAMLIAAWGVGLRLNPLAPDANLEDTRCSADLEAEALQDMMSDQLPAPYDCPTTALHTLLETPR